MASPRYNTHNFSPTSPSYAKSPDYGPTSVHYSRQQYPKSNSSSNREKSRDPHNSQTSDTRLTSSRSASPQIKRIRLTHDDLTKLDKEQLIAKWLQQESFIDALENMIDDVTRQSEQLQHTLESCELRYKRKQLETARRENSLHMKLSIKEKKLQQIQDQLDNINKVQLPTPHQLESTLIDPAINLMFEKMKYEVETAKNRAEEMQNELSAWKFTPDSNTGKRLMAKCRLLHNENEELGKDISSGWVAQLTGNLALQKKFSEEMKKSQSELDEFLLELEEEVEGMQNTIYYLQQQLREARGDKKQTDGININASDIVASVDKETTGASLISPIKEEVPSMTGDPQTVNVKKEALEEVTDDKNFSF